MTTSALNIASIKRNAGTQFRTDMCSEQVEGLTDLIERGVQWKTPIQVARFDGVLFLTDGFHRVEAYEAAGYAEIPAGQYEVVECATMNDVILLAMRANAAHGKHNSTEDRVLMMNKLIAMDEKRFMNGPWEVAVKEVADALQITRDQAKTACKPKNDELKNRRDAAIIELHKDGKSQRKIGEALGITHKVVAKVLEEVVPNGETPFGTTQSSPSILPLANTEDRPETREDARSFIDEQLDALLDPGYIDMGDAPFSLTDDEADAPAARFDVLAATGYGEDLCQYTKPSKPATEYEQVEAAKANPVKLQEEWMELCDEEEVLKAKLAEIIQRKSQVRRIATQSGVALPE